MRNEGLTRVSIFEQFGFQNHQRPWPFQSLEIFGRVSGTIIALAILVECSRSRLRS